MREYTSKEMKLLQANPYTFKVTKHKLYFTTEFKEAFPGQDIRQDLRQGNFYPIWDMIQIGSLRNTIILFHGIR